MTLEPHDDCSLILLQTAHESGSPGPAACVTSKVLLELIDFIPGMQGGALEETHKNETAQHMASPSSNTSAMFVTMCVCVWCMNVHVCIRVLTWPFQSGVTN